MIEIKLGESPGSAAINLTILVMVIGVLWLVISAILTPIIPYPGGFASIVVMGILYTVFWIGSQDLYPTPSK